MNPLHAYNLACDLVRQRMNKDRFYTYAALGLMLVVAILLVVDTFRSRKPVPVIVQNDEKPAAVTTQTTES